jgi:2-polyprenyl-3-methyl-5-hydroxy-6-metoxy-1,4-benzoquinol methylase
MSIKYYNDHANQFIQDTFEADMSATYALFTQYLKPEAIILDIGCGSGRDGKYFLSQGFEVYAHDGSEAMVEHARQFLGDKVALAEFSNFSPLEAFGKELIFDGLWACASLIHVQEENMINVVNNYVSFLKTEGVFFLSFKLRTENHEKDGRSFTNFTREKLIAFVEQCDDLTVIELQETADVRPGRENEGWISVVVRNKSSL